MKRTKLNAAFDKIHEFSIKTRIEVSLKRPLSARNSHLSARWKLGALLIIINFVSEGGYP